ncbi:MAG: GNAT family N-acetyltransferase, partial [Sinobacteraceae bacterium]|nr:GNAT family N-acetyltransferase [Nevskiaceae bacterium]
DLSPWLAALYVIPDCRCRGVGGALVNATVSKARALGVRVLYLYTADREDFYAHLGWKVVDRSDWKVVMSKSTGNQP